MRHQWDGSMDDSAISSTVEPPAELVAALKVLLPRLTGLNSTPQNPARWLLWELGQFFFEMREGTWTWKFQAGSEEEWTVVHGNEARPQVHVRHREALSVDVVSEAASAIALWRRFTSIRDASWTSRKECDLGYDVQTSIGARTSCSDADWQRLRTTTRADAIAETGGWRRSIEIETLDPKTIGVRVRVAVSGPNVEVALELFSRVIIAECLAASQRRELGEILRIETTAKPSRQSDSTELALLDGARTDPAVGWLGSDETLRLLAVDAVGFAIVDGSAGATSWDVAELSSQREQFAGAVKAATLDKEPVRVAALLRTGACVHCRVECLYSLLYFASPVRQHLFVERVSALPNVLLEADTAQVDTISRVLRRPDQNSMSVISALATMDIARLIDDAERQQNPKSLGGIRTLRVDGDRLANLASMFSMQAESNSYDDLVRQPCRWWGADSSSTTGERHEHQTWLSECLKHQAAEWLTRLVEFFANSSAEPDDSAAVSAILRPRLCAIDNDEQCTAIEADSDARSANHLRHAVQRQQIERWVPFNGKKIGNLFNDMHDECIRLLSSDEPFEYENSLLLAHYSMEHTDLLSAIQEAAREKFIDDTLRSRSSLAAPPRPAELDCIVAMLSVLEKGHALRVLRASSRSEFRRISRGAHERAMATLDSAKAKVREGLERASVVRSHAQQTQQFEAVSRSVTRAIALIERIRPSDVLDDDTGEPFSRSSLAMLRMNPESTLNSRVQEEKCQGRLHTIAKSGLPTILVRMAWDAATRSSGAWMARLLANLTLEAIKAPKLSASQTDVAIAASVLAALPTLLPLAPDSEKVDEDGAYSWTKQKQAMMKAEDEADAKLAIARAIAADARRIAARVGTLAARARTYITHPKLSESIIVLQTLLRAYNHCDEAAAVSAIASATAREQVDASRALATARTLSFNSSNGALVWCQRVAPDICLYGSYNALCVATRSGKPIADWLRRLEAAFDPDDFTPCYRHFAIRGTTVLTLSADNQPLIEAQLDIVVECRRPADVDAAPKVAANAVNAALANKNSRAVIMCAAVGPPGNECWGGGGSSRLRSVPDIESDRVALHLLLFREDVGLFAPVVVRCVLWTVGLPSHGNALRYAEMLRENVYADALAAKRLTTVAGGKSNPQSILAKQIVAAIYAGDWRRAYLTDRRLALLDASFPGADSHSANSSRIAACTSPLDARLAAHDQLLSLTEACRSLELDALVLRALVIETRERTVIRPPSILFSHAVHVTASALAFFASPRVVHFRAAALFVCSRIIGADLDCVGSRGDAASSLYSTCLALGFAKSAEIDPSNGTNSTTERLRCHALELLRELTELLSVLGPTLARTLHLASGPVMRSHLFYLTASTAL